MIKSIYIEGDLMKFSVGYQMCENDEFINKIIEFKNEVEEVYFSWGDFANGRNLQTLQQNFTPWEAMEKQIADLKKLHENGIKFNLLFNGNCYGRDSLSRSFYNKIGDTVQYVSEKFVLTSITTTSPLIAKFIKDNFSGIKTRASVNMEIGTVQGMDYLAGYFDGYYVKREYNRNFYVIKTLKNWCDENNKTLHILANSGCLNYCSAHTFHDNLVAHESEISKMDNCYEFSGICHEYLKNHEKMISLVRDTNYIRPEDIDLYEPYFSSVKLATRVSNRPLYILESYIKRKCAGNVLEILEPNHAGRVYPYVIDNQKLNNSYLYCTHNCLNCDKCKQNYENALVNLEQLYQ